MTETTILVGIASGLAGFGLSELLAVVKLTSKVDVHTSQIKEIADDKKTTIELLTSIVTQNTKLLAHLGIDDGGT